MKTSALGLELRADYAFSDDGDLDAVSLTYAGRKLPVQLTQRILDWMGRVEGDRLVDEAWESAEEEGDDMACDEAREAS
jgi:hypothetical protein